jgi:hypothetical protein
LSKQKYQGKTNTMNQHQDYDKIFKESFQRVSQRLLQTFLGIDEASMQPISTTLPRTIERRADFVVTCKNPKSRLMEIYHFEFQSQVHFKMSSRGLLYYGLLFEKHELPVNQFVIYLGNGKWTASTDIKHVNLQYNYQVISLNEIDYNTFVNSDAPEEIIFAILANFKGEDKKMVIQKIIKALENKAKGVKKLQKYIQQLEILSNLRNLQPEIIKQLSTMSITFDIKTDLRYQQGVETGLEQGLEKGLSINAYKVIRNILEEFPDWDDEKIANLANGTIEAVRSIRADMKN